MKRRVSFPTPTRSAICPIVFPSMRGATATLLWRFSFFVRQRRKTRNSASQTPQFEAKVFHPHADSLSTRPRQGGRGQRDTDVNCLIPGNVLSGWKIPPPANESPPGSYLGNALQASCSAFQVYGRREIFSGSPLKFSRKLPIRGQALAERADSLRIAGLSIPQRYQ